MEVYMSTGKIIGDQIETKELRLRITLAVLWIGHFLLWTYGDMLALLQQNSQPVENSLLLFVAVPLAMLQVSTIVLTMVGRKKVMVIVNYIVVIPFIVFNIGYISEGEFGWEYLLGAAYIIVNILILMAARKWQKN